MTLALQHVVRHYPSNSEVVRAVDGVTLTVARGELVVLLGPSGSGKTTLLQLAAGLEAPSEGTVTFDGVELSGLRGRDRARWLREDLGLITQTHRLQPGVTATRNAALKLLGGRMRPSEADRLASRLLVDLGLGHRLEHYAERLSHGERQRVAIARALSTDPALVLADEPTGRLDSARSLQVMELLRTLAHEQQRAVLLVTHDEHAVAFADRVERLADGRLTPDHAPTPAPSG